MLLDPDHGAGIKNWLHLGHELTRGDKELTNRVEDLRLSYAGGGSPAMELFEALSIKKPGLTVNDFQEVAEELDRKDVMFYIKESLPLNSQFRNIGFKHKENLASMLNKNVRGIYDWRSFADEFDYTTQQIDVMKQAIKTPNSYSPTLKLFEMLVHTKPLLSLRTIVDACDAINRKDVSMYLEELIPDN